MFDRETSRNPYADLIAAAVRYERGELIIDWSKYIDYIDASGRYNDWEVGFSGGLCIPEYDHELEAGLDCPYCAPWTWAGETGFPDWVDPEDIRDVANVFGDSVREDVQKYIIDPLHEE